MAKAKHGATISEIKELLNTTKSELKTELKSELKIEFGGLVNATKSELVALVNTTKDELVSLAGATKAEIIGLMEANTGELMSFLHEHMVTKEEHNQLVVKVMHIEDRLETFATKDDLKTTKNEIITTIDHLAKRQDTLDHEQTALRSAYDRLDGRLLLVERKTGIGV